MHPDNPIPEQFESIRIYVDLVAHGDIPCCAISGPAGVGKTRIAKAVLRNRVPHQLVGGTGTVEGIKSLAYRYRNGGVILLDDADNLITGGGTHTSNAMKQLLDPAEKSRRITTATISASKEGAPYPSVFETKVGLVWLTNADLADPALSKYNAAARPHIEALLSRGLRPITVTNDPTWLLDYVADLIVNQDVLGKLYSPPSADVIRDIYDWFIVNAPHLREISPRLVINSIVPLAKRHPTAWKRYVSQLLQPERQPIRPINLPTMRVTVPKKARLVSV